MKPSNLRTSPDHKQLQERLRFFNKQVTNRITMRFAGKRVYAVIHHRGRKSGKHFRTPVVAMPAGDSFIIPLPYGQHVDWCRNLLAAEEGQLESHGKCYTVRAPRLIEPQAALTAFPGWLHGLLRNTTVYLQVDRAAGPVLPPEQKIRKILVYGAGVLGSVYAGMLHQAGYEVTLLAHGKRLSELEEKGLVLVNEDTGCTEQMKLSLTDRLGPQDAYDLVLVIVRKNQLASVLPALSKNQCTPNILFMVNNAAGPQDLTQALGDERVLLGFPGAGGQRVEGIVHYRLTRGIVQPTTIGELDGTSSQRLAQIAQALTAAGFPVAVSGNMDAWLKTHVALVSPVANAIYLAGGSNYRLAHTRDGLVLLVRAVQEGLHVLHALDIPLTPAKFRILPWIPEPLLVAALHKGLNTPQAELVLARHANAALDEMQTLSEEFRVLVEQSGVATPAIDALACYLDPAAPRMPEGQARQKMVWGPMLALTGALVSMGMLAGWLFFRRKKQGG